MEVSFSGFRTKVTADVEKLPFQKLLFFGAWFSEYLYNKYAGYLLEEHEDEEGHQILTDAVAYLWESVDSPAEIDVTVADEHFENLHTIDVDVLDFDETNDTGILKLMECLESALAYTETQNFHSIIACIDYPLDVIDVIMTNDLELDTNNPGKHIAHPLLQEEFDVQYKMIEYLKTHEVTSADKHLFRS
jgi:hypothetical protein